MSEVLTNRQQQILDFLIDYTRTHGFPPSFKEIAEQFNFASLTAVKDHLKALERKGYVRKSDFKARAIEVVSSAFTIDEDTTGIPLLGRVAAGQPILAQENIENYVQFGTYFSGEGKVYALRIQGDSMKDEGILNGDVVIVRFQESANNGDTIVAIIGEEATVKTFFHEGDRIRLQPQNPKYNPIYIDQSQNDDFRIGGRVIGVVRKTNGLRHSS